MWSSIGAIVGFALAGMWGWVYASVLRNDIEGRDRSIEILERQKAARDLTIEALEGKVRSAGARERLLKAESAEHALSCSDAIGRMRSVLDQIDSGD